MFDLNEVAGGDSKFLNAKWLKTIPKMACKVRIVDGGSRTVVEYDDRKKPEAQQRKKKEVYLLVESTTGLFEGSKDMTLNQTNMAILVSGLGDQPNSWRGREIGVYFDPLVKFGDEVKGGLRVKVFEADPFASPSEPVPAAVVAAPVVEDSIPF